MIWALPDDQVILPHPFTAESEGILAVGGQLTPQILLLAYRFGIFPWYSPGDPRAWWFTHPRSVLFPSEIHITKSMNRFRRKSDWRVSIDKSFDQVIAACREVSRSDQETTWIQEDITEVFIELHKLGYAHSIEVWDGNELVGGLYGMAIGKVFYGESMFTYKSNASKMALIYLCELLEKRGFYLIDCQQETDHLNSMGAHNISAEMFMTHLRRNILWCLEKGDHLFSE